MWSIFSCAFWPSACLLWRNVYLDLPTIFGLDCLCFFDVELHELFVYFGYQLLLRYMICRYFLPFSRLPFHFLMVYFVVQKLFDLMQSHWFIFAFVAFAFGVKYKKSLPRPMSKSLPPMFSQKQLDMIYTNIHFGEFIKIWKEVLM